MFSEGYLFTRILSHILMASPSDIHWVNCCYFCALKKPFCSCRNAWPVFDPKRVSFEFNGSRDFEKYLRTKFFQSAGVIFKRPVWDGVKIANRLFQVSCLLSRMILKKTIVLTVEGEWIFVCWNENTFRGFSNPLLQTVVSRYARNKRPWKSWTIFAPHTSCQDSGRIFLVSPLYSCFPSLTDISEQNVQCFLTGSFSLFRQASAEFWPVQPAASDWKRGCDSDMRNQRLPRRVQ